MSRRESKNEERSRESKKSEDKMLLEFENEIKRIIREHKITRDSLPKKAEDELDKAINKLVSEYYE